MRRCRGAVFSLSSENLSLTVLATLLRLHFHHTSLCCAECEEFRCRAGCEQMHASGNDPGPSRLVVGAETSPVVTVEVLIEQDEIAPVRVLLKLPRPAIDRPSASLVFQKDAGEPAPEFLGDLVQVHLPSRACWTFNRERIAVIGVVLQQ